MNDFEYILQATPYVKVITSEIEANPIITLEASGQKALLIWSCQFYHSAIDPKIVNVTIYDGARAYFLYNQYTQSGSSNNALYLYGDNRFCAFPLILIPNTASGRYLQLKYTVSGLNAEDEDCTIRAVVYELSGFVPR